MAHPSALRASLKYGRRNTHFKRLAFTGECNAVRMMAWRLLAGWRLRSSRVRFIGVFEDDAGDAGFAELRAGEVDDEA